MFFDERAKGTRLITEAKSGQFTGRQGIARPPQYFAGMLSRRRFLGGAAGAAGVIAGSGVALPRVVRAAALPPGIDPDADDFPQHLPQGGFGVPGFYVYGPGAASENSTIWDFDGFIGVVQGNVDGMGRLDGEAREFFKGANYNVDMRFMSGDYEGLDGRIHHGSFALI